MSPDNPSCSSNGTTGHPALRCALRSSRGAFLLLLDRDERRQFLDS
jgi:hypothetical protein